MRTHALTTWGGLCLSAVLCVCSTLSTSDGVVHDTPGPDGHVDTAKHNVLYLYNTNSASDAKLRSAFTEAAAATDSDLRFAPYRAKLYFFTSNMDAHSEHQKDLQDNNVELPAIVFWPAGCFRPSAKLNTANPSAAIVSDWLFARLREEEAVLLSQTSLPVVSNAA